VKVLAPDGSVLVDRLEAGQTWRADLEPVAEVDPAQVGTSPDHARRLLARAREQIAARDLAGAQTTIQAALEAPHGTREAAEAATLRAEIAKNSGNLEAAFRAYRDVARRYSRLPAGESALFAAARIAVQRGDRASARQLFDNYLQRYPSGRYRAEVLRNREALGP
jgi:TolA-binding protein